MISLRTVIACGLMIVLTTPVFAQQIFDQWQYTLMRPASGWWASDFDDSEWKKGDGGFGTHRTSAARVGTHWKTGNIWLRKKFRLASLPAKPAILIHHDEDARVFINGTEVLTLDGYTTRYILVPIDPDKANQVLREGENLLAVHCKQTDGAQFIDVHVVDQDAVPELPKPKRNPKPYQSDLITTWGEAVSPDNAWTEYPRPAMKRDQWTRLNGSWDYAVTSIKSGSKPESWDGKILVPYCLESKLGGVQRLLEPTEALWYRRTFDAEISSGKRLLLHFEAVDYRCEVWVNGQTVGTHVGGHTPFSFDVSDAVRNGQNELVVRVQDATEEYQLRGKQVLHAHGIWYTQVSGIWQSVWLEEVPEQHIENLKISTPGADGTIRVQAIVRNAKQTSEQATRQASAPENQSFQLRLKVFDEQTQAARVQRAYIPGAKVQGSDLLEVHLKKPKLWSPDNPFLYDLEIQLLSSDGKLLDSVTSYVGIRTVGKTLGDDGHWRLTLNGDVIFHWGPLDQGWWPDGLLTPPSDQAMLFDVRWLKDAGFNMIRKHIKVEPRRYYYYCDRLGMMVWQDHVSGGSGRDKGWPGWTRLKPYPKDADWPPEEHRQFMFELESMIGSLENHPSIVCWVPFNEAWGQHKTMEVGRWTVDRDPSRIVNVASGGNFWPVGDIVDEHSYPHPAFPFELNKGGRFDGYVKVMGEFGGHGFPVAGHLWNADRRNWGYGGLPENKDEYKQRYQRSLQMLDTLRQQGIAAGVYTQTTDVEGEINGLMTYDRKVIKIPAKVLAEMHQKFLSGDL